MNSLQLTAAVVGVLFAMHPSCPAAAAPAAAPWKVGTPIVTYWAGPSMTDATAAQMAEGGFNLVWCGEKELDVAQRHGLRGQLTDGLLTPAALEDAAQREKLDALIARVRHHPALYDYFITDEPSATNFPALGKLIAYLRERDPAHLAYINLFPTYANNEQLGTKGDTVTAYREHLRQYVDVVKPGLISYDHYQFSVKGDNDGYFLNLAMIRRAAQDAGLPFLNIVQAATWAASMRVPTGDEVRYLDYTSLAYGAQGISYYVYCCAGHTGAVAHADGTVTPLYHTLKTLNREFVSIAQQLQPLRSLGVYHAGMRPQGTEPVPADGRFQLDPPVPDMSYTNLQPVKGVLLGYFGPPGKGKKAPTPTHVMVINLDYQAEVVVGIRGPSRLELFDPATGRWSRASGKRADLPLARGGGQLVRVRR
jgi:hypothetical protein